MERLRRVIEEHGHWADLVLYIDRVEGHVEADFAHALENVKALLETIGKEICQAKGEELPATCTFNDVLKKSFSSLGYSNRDLVNQVSRSLANIGQHIGTLRNEISPTSHGKSLGELRERNNKVDLITREFLIDSSQVVAVFLIRTFEENKAAQMPVVPEGWNDEQIDYDEMAVFNDSWDDSYGEFEMGDYSYTASEILFNVDYQAYQTECLAYVAEGGSPAELEGEA